MVHVINGPFDALSMLMLALRAALVIWALVGVYICLRTPAGAFVAASKWIKNGWIAVCGVAAVIFAIAPLSFFGIAAIVAVGVFYADVRPAVAK